MAIATFRGEKNVGEVADKLYSRLTPKQRVTAEAALIKANPQLRNISTVQKGTVLRIPDLPELRAKTTRTLENPDDQIAKDVSEKLAAFGERIGERISIEKKSLKEQSTLLKSAKFKKDTGKAGELKEVVKEAAKVVTARTKAVADREKLLNKSLKAALSDLKDGLK